jgi:DNA-binding LacI/PurR family transcriptional regulator/ribosomal protein S25
LQLEKEKPMPASTVKQQRRKKRLTASEVVQAQRLCRERLLSDLLEQKAAPGAPIAGERSLCEQYGIPLSVIRTTLTELKNEGLITSVPRGGMRLAGTPELPKSLVGVKVGFVGYMEVTNPDSRTTRPAVICAGLERILNEQGGTLQFLNLWGAVDFQSIVEDIKQKNIEAILYTGREYAAFEGELRTLSELGLPLVAIEKRTNLCDSVVFDNVQIGRTQAEHTIELGHRQVCVLQFPEFEWSTVRARSIREEFLKQGLTEPESVTFHYPPLEVEVGATVNRPYVMAYPPLEAEIREFVRQKARSYTACIVVNDELACLLLTEARKQGIRVPEELSVIGVDDRLDMRHFNLTTVQLSHMELGLTAFEILKEKILKPEPSRKPKLQLLACPLIVRETTAPCQLSTIRNHS